MDSQQNLKVELKISEVWMVVENPNISIEEAVDKLKNLGHSILEVDKENNRIKVVQGSI